MSSKLGVYWSVAHRRPQDYDYFRRLNPSVVKIMNGGPPDYAWVRANLPGALVIARDWALSEQHDDMRRDPTGTGKRHAQEWAQHAPRLGFDRANTLVLGINEPRVWEPDMLAAVVPYTVAFCDECARLGLRAGALQLGVGWPANTGPDTPPNWRPYAPVADAIARGNHALVCHEYWADQGPGENWGWWAGRTLRCPWDVPIVIGECGVDMYVKDPSVPHHSRGWQGRVSSERYAHELAEYASRMSADRRFVGCCVFASDFANREWAPFDVQPAYQAILATPVPVPQPPPGGNGTVYMPVVSGGPSQPQPQPQPNSLAHPIADPAQRKLSQGWMANPQAYAQFGVRGHTGIDYAVPIGTPVRAVDTGTVLEAQEEANWGKYIKLRHAWGESIYAHLSRQDVNFGQIVQRGQTIGLSGNTGNSTGPHLHLGIRLNPIRRGAADPTGMDGWTDPLPYLESAPGDTGDIWAILQAAAQEFGVDRYLLASLVWAESSFRPNVVSDAGAKGLGQIMDSTWQEWAAQVGAGDPFDARDNARVSAAYLRYLLRALNNERAALYAYAWGIGRILAGKTPPDEVVVYAEKIIFGRDLLRTVN